MTRPEVHMPAMPLMPMRRKAAKSEQLAMPAKMVVPIMVTIGAAVVGAIVLRRRHGGEDGPEDSAGDPAGFGPTTGNGWAEAEMYEPEGQPAPMGSDEGADAGERDRQLAL